jgi:YgiT-type zinc finger domain-containing protein
MSSIYLRRFFASTTLRSPGGFGGGSGSGLGAGGASIASSGLEPTYPRRVLSSSVKIGRHCRIMRRKRSEGESAPMTLGGALSAKVRLIVWCKACGHRAEPDVAEQVARYGGGTTVIDWASGLRCSACGEREVDFVDSGAKR